MDKMNWIKDLVRAEQKMEESGVIDFVTGFNPAEMLESETTAFMNKLKSEFIESASAFNQLKGSSVGRIKIYGLSNSPTDFMLFRNGFKLVFMMKESGMVGIRFHYVGTTFTQPPASDNGQAVPSDEDILQARWGAFGDLIWTFQEQEIKTDFLVRYYLTRFVRESAK